MQETSKITVGISSRALFDLDESHRIFEQKGTEQYAAYQRKHEKEKLAPGVGFHLVRKLLRISEQLGDKAEIEVVLISRNSADTGLRIFHSIKAHDMDIRRAAFCGGRSAHRYLSSFGIDLFLSTDGADVSGALEAGFPAATVLPGSPAVSSDSRRDDDELRIAFDGDSVLFDAESETVYQQKGLDAFVDAENDQAHTPMGKGPLLPFLSRLQTLQRQAEGAEARQIRTALVTARGTSACERAIRTLRHWELSLDECLFLGSNEKTGFLQSFGADFFFDDKDEICRATAGAVATGHVPPSEAPKQEEPKQEVQIAHLDRKQKNQGKTQ